MFDNEIGIFCINEDPEMPNMPNMQDPMFPAHISLAMMYVPYQKFENLYDADTALSRGTLFKSLDLPFYGGKRGIMK